MTEYRRRNLPSEVVDVRPQSTRGEGGLASAHGTTVDKSRPASGLPIRGSSKRSLPQRPDDIPTATGPEPGLAKVDICFVFDTTDSMLDKQERLIVSMSTFVHSLEENRLDWTATAVPFGDLRIEGDLVIGSLPYRSSAKEVMRLLEGMPRFKGGGNGAESAIDAMSVSFGKPYRSGAIRVFILLTDDGAYEHGPHTIRSVDEGLTDAQALCFVCSPPYSYYKHWAEAHGGRWFEIRDVMEPSQMKVVIEDLLKSVAVTARAVAEIGSVKDYLALNRGSH